MARPKLIVIGGSAGAIPSVLEIARGLPSHFSVPICVVIHFHPDTHSVLPMLLESSSGIPSKHPQTQEFLMPRHIYVAPPDQHMVIHKNRILLHRGPHENRCRPAIDPLFRTAASAYGPDVTGVLLSGYLDDGTEGLLAIKNEGGQVIIQDPADTPFNDMPRHALAKVRPNFILPHKEICTALVTLAEEGYPPRTAQSETGSLSNTQVPTGQTASRRCSPCHGPLDESAEVKSRSFSQAGHAYSSYNGLEEQQDALKRALCCALRALDDKATLNRRLLRRAEELNQTLALRKYRKQIDSTEVHIQLICDVLTHWPPAHRKVSDLE